MGYTLSRATAQKVLRIIGERDLSPVPTTPRFSGASGQATDPHLVVRVTTVQPNPVAPAQAWTLDGTPVSAGVVNGIRVYGMAMAGNEGPYVAVGRGLCIAHRVRGVVASVSEVSNNSNASNDSNEEEGGNG